MSWHNHDITDKSLRPESTSQTAIPDGINVPRWSTTSTTSTVYSTPLNKRQIIERLFTLGHISFDEMWTLIVEDDSSYIIRE